MARSSSTIDFEGHRVRLRVREKDCGRNCRGCPHQTTVAEVTMPSGRVRELWGEPPTSSGVRAGPARTRRSVVYEKPAVRGPSSVTVRKTRPW